MNRQQRVEEIIRIIGQNHKADILACFADDAVFHNVPMEPARGHDAIWAVFAMIHDQAEAVRWDILHIAETRNGLVMTERVDNYLLNGRWASFPVMGIVELDDKGKVTR